MKRIFIGFLSLLNFQSLAQAGKETFIADSTFVLFDNLQDRYIGTYRDGKPYHGYFRTVYSEYEIWLVDYYEKGELTYQYSKKNIPEENYYDDKKRLDKKSTYENGKIFNGIEYAFIEKGITCKQIRNGIMESFIVHMFAPQYYNQLMFDKKDSLIRVTNMLEEGFEITYRFTGKGMTSRFQSPDFSIHKNYDKKIDLFNLPKSSLIYYIQSQDGMICNVKNKVTDNERQPFYVNIQVYSNLKMSETEHVNQAFLQLADYFSQAQALNEIFYSEGHPADLNKEKQYILALIDTDSDGSIIKGICWVDAPIAYYQEYLTGSIIKKKEMNISDFQNVAAGYYKTMMVLDEEQE